MDQIKMLIDGTKIMVGPKEYVAPPLNLKAMRRLLPRIQALQSSGAVPTDVDMDTIVEVIHSALVRNYPDITTEEIEEGIDMGNMRTVMRVVLGASGLVPGNAVAATAPENLTGQNSTGTSSPPQDGPMPT